MGVGRWIALGSVEDVRCRGARWAARGGWVRVLSRVPSSSRPARRSSGCVFARWGHRRCLYPCGPGTLGPGGRKRRARRAAPAARRLGPQPLGFGPGLWSGRVGVVGRVLSSLRVRPDRWCSWGPRPPENCPRGRVSVRWGHRRCLYPCGPGTLGSGEWSRPGGRARRDCWGCGPGAPPYSLPAWWACCWVRAGRVGVVGCGVSGRLVRRRCRSGRCAGGTRGRGRTSQWWSPPPGG